MRMHYIAFGHRVLVIYDIANYFSKAYPEMRAGCIKFLPAISFSSPSFIIYVLDFLD